MITVKFEFDTVDLNQDTATNFLQVKLDKERAETRLLDAQARKLDAEARQIDQMIRNCP